jgi:hypothetical protein
LSQEDADDADSKIGTGRCHEFPEGGSTHGYELHLPLTPAGKLDRNFWPKHRQGGGFRRFWGKEGTARAAPARSQGLGSVLRAAPEDVRDEMIFRGDDHRFVAGEYVSIAERDGVTRTFRVAAVT